MKKWLAAGIIAVLVLAGVLTFTFQRTIGERIFANVAAQRIVSNDLTFGDGLHLVLCGTGSPLQPASRTATTQAIDAALPRRMKRESDWPRRNTDPAS